jgi:hypothetical protein
MAQSTTTTSALKQCLQAIVGIPAEAAIKQYGAQLTPDQANYLRSLTKEDIDNIRSTEGRLFQALGESGDGCGVYN